MELTVSAQKMITAKCCYSLKVFFRAGLFLITSLAAYSAHAEQQLKMVISNLQESEGPVYYQVYKLPEQKCWSDTPYLQDTANVSKQNNIIYIPLPEAGRYAIRLYQDTNNNAQLDQTRRGLPKEPVAFSNNLALLGKPPTLSESSFQFPDQSLLKIRLKSRPRPPLEIQHNQ